MQNQRVADHVLGHACDRAWLTTFIDNLAIAVDFWKILIDLVLKIYDTPKLFALLHWMVV